MTKKKKKEKENTVERYVDIRNGIMKIMELEFEGDYRELGRSNI